jgi:hypothetical protein
MERATETTHERTTRYRLETERAVSAALLAEYRLRLAELESRAAVWQARIAELES